MTMTDNYTIYTPLQNITKNVHAYMYHIHALLYNKSMSIMLKFIYAVVFQKYLRSRYTTNENSTYCKYNIVWQHCVCAVCVAYCISIYMHIKVRRKRAAATAHCRCCYAWIGYCRARRASVCILRAPAVYVHMVGVYTHFALAQSLARPGRRSRRRRHRRRHCCRRRQSNFQS